MNKHTPKIKYFACALIVLECLIFGFAFIAVKSLLQTNIPPFFLITIRFLFGAIILLVSGLILGKTKKLSAAIGKISSFKRSEVFGGVVSGITLFVAFALQTVGANYTTPAKNSLFTEIFVIVVPIVNMIIGKKFSIRPLLAAIITFMGVTLVLNIYGDKSNFNIGDGLTIGCGVMFAIQFIILDKLIYRKHAEDKINAFNFTFIQLVVVAVLALITTLIFERTALLNIRLTSENIIWLCFLSVFATAIAYLLQFFAQERISAELTSVLSCSDSVFALVLSIIFGFDIFTWTLVGGAVLMLLGMLLATLQLKGIQRINNNEDKKGQERE